jgi:hypothetical protein
VKSRTTTLKRGDIALEKNLQQGGAGYVVNLKLSIDHTVENVLLTDPLPTGATRGVVTVTYPNGASRIVNLNSDGIMELGKLEPGVYIITYVLFSDLAPEFALTDPDIEWQEVEP